MDRPYGSIITQFVCVALASMYDTTYATCSNCPWIGHIVTLLHNLFVLLWPVCMTLRTLHAAIVHG